MIPAWLQQLEASALTALLRESAWLQPALEVTHVVGLVMLVGGASAFDLSLLRHTSKHHLEPLFGTFLTWARMGLLLTVLSGTSLFIASPIELFLNAAFRVKLLLLVLAGLNAAVFHTWTMHRSGHVQRFARVHAVFSLFVWFAVIVFGRLIALV